MEALSTPPLLDVSGLAAEFATRNGPVRAVDGISFSVLPGEILCVVGESGSGKSATAKSILQLLDRPGRVVGGRVIWRRADNTTVDLAGLDPRGREIRTIRGREIAMVFQEPMSSLSPVHRVGDQIGEMLAIHFAMPPAQRRVRVLELLGQVEIADPATAIDRYPFEFSGGMRQRVMIAMALACNPRLLIADEPTTALDVTTQAEILDLIGRLQKSNGMAVMFITHDMGVVAEIASRVLVMYRGRIMEQASVRDVFAAPAADYTRRLIGSVLRLEQKAEARAERPAPVADSTPLLRVSGLSMQFGAHRAVDDVSLTVRPGETFGIVGESGSGKTTLGRCLLRIYQPTAGAIEFDTGSGIVDIAKADRRQLRDVRRQARMIFQDPASSLDPRKTVAQIIGEPLWLAGVARGRQLDERVAGLMQRVGLEPAWRERYPHAFSGGQRQRIGIARAIALQPRLIIADEATSALDVSLRAQMLDLMLQLQDELGLSYIFVSHDISVIRYICDRVGVMYRGRMVEVGDTEQVTRAPIHNYTKALLSAVPHPDPDHRRIAQRFRYIAEDSPSAVL